MTTKTLVLLLALSTTLGCGGGVRESGETSIDSPSATKRSNSTSKQPAKNWSTTPTAKGQEAVHRMLGRLDSFKDEPKFHEYGFGRGGPYHAWMIELNEIRDSEEGQHYSVDERIAITRLYQMGMDYVRSKGQETKFTLHVRDEIKKSANPE